MPPVALPVSPQTVEELIEEYPELKDELLALTAWRETGQPDHPQESLPGRSAVRRPKVRRGKSAGQA